jgi:hypothetical protein
VVIVAAITVNFVITGRRGRRPQEQPPRRPMEGPPTRTGR